MNTKKCISSDFIFQFNNAKRVEELFKESIALNEKMDKIEEEDKNDNK